MNFYGYRRKDGKVGIRNYVAVIPSVFCANKVAQNIASQVDGCVCLTHPVGCSQVGEDLEVTARTLIAMSKHPNLAAVLIVGLGCERFTPSEFYSKAKESGKPIEKVVIQEEGDSLKAIEKGVSLAKRLASDAALLNKELCDISDLTVAVKCGGTDATSGIAANPTVGSLSDIVVKNGGSIIFSEVTELLGTEHILARRAVDEGVAKKIYDTIYRTEAHLREIGTVEKYKHRGALISTGNFDGGVSSVVEKALGGMYKSGNQPITDVLEYATAPKTDQKGVFLMDSPGHDGEVVTGMVGGGAQIVVFTTGRGTPTGFPFAPVIKVTGKKTTFERMRENIDFDASSIIMDATPIEEKGKELFDLVLEVANGRKTKSELLLHDELFCITRK